MQRMSMEFHKLGVPDTRFHVRPVRHLFFLWKLLLMSSAIEKQHATKSIDWKRKFMELMMRKPLYFC